MADAPAELRDDWLEPHPRRLAPGHAHREQIVALHQASVDRNLPTYRDPVSGFSVFTAKFLAGRGYCCESGCRHCPYVI